MGTLSFLMQLQLDAHNQEAIIAIHYSVCMHLVRESYVLLSYQKQWCPNFSPESQELHAIKKFT